MKDNLLDGEYLITKDYTDWMVKTGGYAKDMTLRDHFAVLAMQNFADEIAPHSDQEWFERITRGAYRMADAMLKERAK
jgi:hypothetical protein